MHATKCLLLVALALGCARTYAASVAGPRLAWPDAIRSETVIVGVPIPNVVTNHSVRERLPQLATFVVAKDRRALTFTVQLAHVTAGHADIASYEIWLEDQDGHRSKPAQVVPGMTVPVSGTTGALDIHDMPIQSSTLVFTPVTLRPAKDCRLTLVLQRPERTLRFEWTWAEAPEAGCLVPGGAS